MPAPRLANVSNVELCHAGTWDITSGANTTFSRNDFVSAVAALSCPAIRNPVLKIGHRDKRIPAVTEDGQPTIGWIGNLRLGRDGYALVGDYRGMPAWMTDVDSNGNSVIASAFPDRSIEGHWDFRCQLGHCHPFVVTALSLLGEMPPGVGTLSSLNDIAALYAGQPVAASTGGSGVPVVVTIHASKESAVPNPKPVMVTASVSLDDLREEFREAADWDQWITEVILNPLQLIVMDDGSGGLLRVPVTIGADDSITFGQPVPVRVSYVDDAEEIKESGGLAASAPSRIVFASRAESKPGDKPPVRAADGDPTPPYDNGGNLPPGVSTGRRSNGKPIPLPPQATQPLPPTDPPTVPAAEPEPPTEPKEDPVSDLSEIRSRLGLPDTADETAILAALDEKLGKPTGTEPPAPTAQATDPAGTTPTEPAAPAVEAQPEPVAAAASLPPGVVTIDAARLEALERDAKAGAAAAARQRHEDRDRFLGDAVRAGKFAPARVEHWRKAWDADPTGTKATIDALAAGLVPVGQPKGYAGGEELDDPQGDAEDARLFAPGTLKKES